jgi:hypothetical protein
MLSRLLANATGADPLVDIVKLTVLLSCWEHSQGCLYGGRTIDMRYE